MKKNLLFGLVLTILTVAGYCAPVDSAKAKLVASNFWSAVTGNIPDGRFTDVSSTAGFEDIRIFSRDGGGFVIVASDDRVQPVLGYSESNSITLPLPAHVEWFLRGYEREIAFCRQHDIEATDEIEALWLNLLKGTYSPAGTTAVAPMLTTTWSQNPYYNEHCPDSAGIHAVAGCSAIATAQVMKYWNWPVSGVGSHSYYLELFGDISADFGSTTYDWSHMPNALYSNSTSTQVNAVAELVFHVGVSIEMNYGLNASGAHIHSYPGYGGMACSQKSLKENFRYKNTLYSLFKDYTEDDEWVAVLKEELDAGRPVIETGYGDGGGHAFVCDGYDNAGMFHVNWGWGSYMDGYFAHNALNPGEGGTGGNNDYTFNDSKGILVGIEPDRMIEVTPVQVHFPQAGGSTTITVTPNPNVSEPWYASCDQQWLTFSPNNGTSANGPANLTLTATQNSEDDIRTATITFVQGGNQVTVTVTQFADSCIITQLPWTEDFESGLSCWTRLDSDGDGNNWFMATGAPNSGLNSMVSYSYNSNLGGAINANNYLITPSIMLPSGSSPALIFYACSGNSNHPDSIAVRLSTGSGVMQTEFDVELMPQTVIKSSLYRQFYLDLSEYAGQVVRIALVHKSYDGVYLSVDDISVVDAATTSTISVYSANSSMGTVTGGGIYYGGAAVEIEAVAGSGYRFTGWSDGETKNPRTVTVFEDATYIANFDNLGGSEHHYDNGVRATNITSGGNIFWGVRFPAGELSDFTTLTGARLWSRDTGSVQLLIYQGGESAPGTLAASQSFQLTGGDTAWVDAVLTTPITLDNTLSLWVIFNKFSQGNPASGSNYAGNPDGSWISLDGSAWNSVRDYNFDLTWMVRAMLSGEIPSTQHNLGVLSSDINMGVASGSNMVDDGQSVEISATALPGYRFTGWSDGLTNNPRTVCVTSDTAFTALFDDLGDNERHYDNGSFVTTIGAGGSIHWAVKFPAGTLAGYEMIEAVKIMDKAAGDYSISIYSGNTLSNGAQLATLTATLTGTNDWYTVSLPAPVYVNHSLPIWIVLYNSGVEYPAAASHYAGNPDGSWVSLDGSSWNSICDYNYYITWMVRAVLGNSEPLTFSTLTAVPADPNQGGVTGGGNYPTGTIVTIKANPSSHHHFTNWSDGSTENPRNVTVDRDTVFTAYFDIDVHQITVVSAQPDMGEVIGGGTYPYGTVIEIEAMPFDGYEFLRWSGGNTENPRQVTVTGNKTYSALFQPTVGISDNVMDKVSVYSVGGMIYVEGAEGRQIEVFDLAGRLVVSDADVSSGIRTITVPASGVYLVRAGAGTIRKVTVMR